MKVIMHIFLTQQYMEMGHQLHALTVVSLGKQPLVPIRLDMVANQTLFIQPETGHFIRPYI
jgi:hypothetical protein